ncbi:chromate transporter [Alkalibaculum sp. M08DMB]|uniref:Chromate transporter n=1 Tax=Alkalibaculum sporogenes TaxID=2655001 RepID=A0A6A7K9Z2_9FIRM|nr:chromate transporter [Alkalibaculum sporogenes]
MIMLLFIVFFRVGLFTFGGGYAMIPILEEAVIDTYQWLSHAEFIDIIAISEMTPGVIAVNMATFLGTRASGTIIGGIVATLGVVLPSSIIVYLISHYFKKFKDNIYIQKILTFIRQGVPGIIATAAYTLFKGAIIDYKSVIILLIVTFLIIKKRTNPILLLLGSALAGILIY